MVGLCWRQAEHGLLVPFLPKQSAVLTQYAVDYGPSCGSVLGLRADSATLPDLLVQQDQQCKKRIFATTFQSHASYFLGLFALPQHT